MKSLKTLLAAALLSVSATAMAQNSEDGVRYEFKKHPFINIQGGAQYTLGEAKFSDLISPNFQLGFGYQFSPAFAARIQANAFQSKGGWSGSYNQTYKWKYVAPGIDLMLNLSNLFAGFNPFRVVNVTAFLGGGANIGFGNDDANELDRLLGNRAAQFGGIGSNYDLEYVWDGTKVRAFGRGGVEVAFRLSNAVSILVEGNANILSDKYNSKNGGNADWYFNALAGLRINLGKTYNKIVPPAPEPEPVIEPEPEPEPVVEPVVVKIEPIRRDVFFKINEYKILDSEASKIKDIADYMAKYPNSKVSINGYADAGTGNDRINDRLAAQRADVVVKELKEKYGISADRITYDSHGARVQPFAENDKNRVSICIAE
jgi:outer membrane protein OmpA-like peptidoglycan-associated protein